MELRIHILNVAARDSIHISSLFCFFNHLMLWITELICINSSVHAQLLQLCATLWTVACPGPLSMGFSRARMPEWAAMPSSRILSRPRNQTHGISCVLCITGRFFTTEIPGKPQIQEYITPNWFILHNTLGMAIVCFVIKRRDYSLSAILRKLFQNKTSKFLANIIKHQIFIWRDENL